MLTWQSRRLSCSCSAGDPSSVASTESKPALCAYLLLWKPLADEEQPCLQRGRLHKAFMSLSNGCCLYDLPSHVFWSLLLPLPPACRRGLGLGASSSDGSGRAVAAFAFGPPEQWQRFSVYFLTADGSLWSLCPVVPFGEQAGAGMGLPSSGKGHTHWRAIAWAALRRRSRQTCCAWTVAPSRLHPAPPSSSAPCLKRASFAPGLLASCRLPLPRQRSRAACGGGRRRSVAERRGLAAARLLAAVDAAAPRLCAR